MQAEKEAEEAERLRLEQEMLKAMAEEERAEYLRKKEEEERLRKIAEEEARLAVSSSYSLSCRISLAICIRELRASLRI